MVSGDLQRPTATQPPPRGQSRPDESIRGRGQAPVRLLDVPLVKAAQNVIPVAVTAGDKIEGLRQCLCPTSYPVLQVDHPNRESDESPIATAIMQTSLTTQVK